MYSALLEILRRFVLRGLRLYLQNKVILCDKALGNPGALKEREKKKKKTVSPFVQLNLGVLSFYLDNEKADRLTKMDHRAKNSRSWGLNSVPHRGDSRQKWRVYFPVDYFTQPLTELEY